MRGRPLGILLAILSLLLIPEPRAIADPVKTAGAADSTRSVLSFRAPTCLEDIYFGLRSLFTPESSVDYSASVPLTDVFRRTRDLVDGLPTPLAWGAIDARMIGCERARTLVERWTELPESLAVPRAGSVALRQPALALARALEAAEPELEARCAERKARIEFDDAAARLSARFEGPLRPAVSEVCAALALPVPASIGVLLVTQAPPPGAVTLRTAEGQVCVVGLSELEGTLLEEAVLHEAIHAADAAAASGVLAELRTRLEKAGVAKNDPRYRDAVHTIFFVQAAETIRHLADPAHVDYGDARGYYARVGPLADAVRAAWTAHLRGEAMKDEALERIVAAAKGS